MCCSCQCSVCSLNEHCNSHALSMSRTAVINGAGQQGTSYAQRMPYLSDFSQNLSCKSMELALTCAEGPRPDCRLHSRLHGFPALHAPHHPAVLNHPALTVSSEVQRLQEITRPIWNWSSDFNCNIQYMDQNLIHIDHNTFLQRIEILDQLVCLRSPVCNWPDKLSIHQYIDNCNMQPVTDTNNDFPKEQASWSTSPHLEHGPHTFDAVSSQTLCQIIPKNNNTILLICTHTQSQQKTPGMLNSMVTSSPFVIEHLPHTEDATIYSKHKIIAPTCINPKLCSASVLPHTPVSMLSYPLWVTHSPLQPSSHQIADFTCSELSVLLWYSAKSANSASTNRPSAMFTNGLPLSPSWCLPPCW